MALKDVVAGDRNEEGIASALAVLKQQLGDKVQTG